MYHKNPDIQHSIQHKDEEVNMKFKNHYKQKLIESANVFNNKMAVSIKNLMNF